MGLYLYPDERIRLKSFSGISKGAKATIRIELETDDMAAFGYFLDGLRRLKEEQAAATQPKPKVRLALPKPEAI